MRRYRGFSLLETLIVLTVISILAVVAVPLYLNYDTRAKVSEGLVMAGPIEAQVTEYYQVTGKWPSSNSVAGINPAASYQTEHVDNINLTISNSGTKITVTYRIAALGGNNTLVITPASFNSPTVRWTCKGGTLIDKYRPPVCRS